MNNRSWIKAISGHFTNFPARRGGENEYRQKTARAVGLLFLTATVAYIAGNGLLASILNAPDYLANVYLNRTQVVIGVLLEFIDTAAVVGIGIMLFPIVRKHSEAIALGYVSSRILECAFLVVGGLSSLSLITLSQKYGQAGTQDASYFQTLGTMTMSESHLAYQIAMIALGLGSVMFCYLLYKSKLIPRLLAVWGLVGYGALLTGGFLEILGLKVGLALSVPGGLFEIVFPLWLIFRGFSSSTIGSQATRFSTSAGPLIPHLDPAKS